MVRSADPSSHTGRLPPHPPQPHSPGHGHGHPPVNHWQQPLGRPITAMFGSFDEGLLEELSRSAPSAPQEEEPKPPKPWRPGGHERGGGVCWE